MDTKIIILTIVSCIHADNLNTNLLPPDLPPANVANIFHESGITFVSPTSRRIEVVSSIVSPSFPITHAFGFISHDSNGLLELVRTHSSQSVASIPALQQHSSSRGILLSNDNGKITSHRNANDDQTPQVDDVVRINIQSPLTDIVQSRYIPHENFAVHEINSRTQHFEYKIPLTRNFVQNADSKNTKHTTYGVPSLSATLPSQTPSQLPSQIPSSTPEQIPSQSPLEPTFIPSQDEIDALPVFQNDKFLSPIVRTNAPTIHSNIELPAKTKANIFDTSFLTNSPATRTRVDAFNPSAHSKNAPTTPTRDTSFHTNSPATRTRVDTFNPSAHSENTPTTRTRDTSFREKSTTARARVKTFNPSAQSTHSPTTPTRDTSFREKSPITRTRVDTVNPSAESAKSPTTHTTENIIGDNNQYANRFSLSDGTKVSEQGKLISPQVGWENVISKTGEYEYISPEGIPVKVKWIADHEGFRVLN